MKQNSSEKIERLMLKVELDDSLGSPFYCEFSNLAKYLHRLMTEDIEDIWQNTFLKLISKNKKGNYGIDIYHHYLDDCTPLIADASLKPWLKRVLLNSSIDFYRNKKGSRKKEILSTDLNASRLEKEIIEFTSREIDPLEVLLTAETDDQLKNAIDKLDELHKQTIYLVGYQKLKYREAAEILNIPLGTVKSRFHNAKHLLLEVYKEVA